MKIPYAYMVIDGVVFFQSQNNSKMESAFGDIGRKNGYSVKSFAYPEYVQGELYLNGNELNKTYNTVRIPLSEFKHLLLIIKEHNARLNNV